MSNIPWWGYVILAGLSWGTYVPLIFYGGQELGGKTAAGGRLASILCVGVAYFVLAVLVPVVLMGVARRRQAGMEDDRAALQRPGRCRRALGAICVIFASKRPRRREGRA